ncbi:MAG: hypothetical protein AAGI38_05275 [Bacteroidota bacterium]
MSVETRKKNIIDKIKLVNDNWLLKSIEQLLLDVGTGEFKQAETPKNALDFSFYVGTIEDKVDLEKIKLERPLKQLNMKAFEETVDSLEWEQSIEELLEDLK